MVKSAARNIILLSDGTGNSSLSPTKSNVWRIYQALDLGPDSKGAYKQIAFYDDGVGTSGFRPLYLLGSAFGWGLSRNVRQLYESLCRHYEPGDNIYIFGFSRGAFTARVLAHFISTCGILNRDLIAPNSKNNRQMNTDEGLRQGVRLAYKSYRRGYWDKASTFLRKVSKPLRLLRNTVLGKNVPAPQDFKKQYSHAISTQAEDGKKLIEFIGVWDTVDAVGLPIDELASLMNATVYPYQFPDQDFSPDVRRACHGLAVDDERQSFHPLLWNELGEKDPNRIKQVWFAGMHSNVGGSYPEDHLAYIALDWMIDEVKEKPQTKTKPGQAGLIFNKAEVAAIKQKAQPLGKMYDSRRGAAVYYRYKPRRIHDLCNDKNRGVTVGLPKIHHSVLDRIEDNTVGYAPTAMPEKFSIIGENGKPVSARRGSRYYESAEDRETRVNMLERTQNHIFWRRLSYFMLLILTICLIFLPQFRPPIPGVETRITADLPGWAWNMPGWFSTKLSWLLVTLESFYTWAFNVLAPSLPALTHHWADAWAQSSGLFSALLLSILVFFAWTKWIISNTQRIAEAGWWHTKKLAPDERYNDGPFIFEKSAGWLRGNAIYKVIRWMCVKLVIPTAFFSICLYLTTGAIYRVFMHYPFVSDGVCSFEDATQRDANANATIGNTVTVKFDTRTPCHDTGVMIEAGRKYTVTVTEDSKPSWEDLDTPTEIGGLDSFFDNFIPAFLLAIPARRHIAKPWFALLGEIGADSGNVIPLNRAYFSFTARARGTLYIYVNDAINAAEFSVPVSRDPARSSTLWDAFYKNNSGTATITITAQK